jgi:CelD/BcsL family acetyltransferase involved in cellulose biosynthesis
MRYSVTECSDFHEFLAIEEEWNELLTASGSDLPFLRHEWLSIWWRHFGPPNRLAVITGRREGRLAFALPLMEVRRSYAGIRITVLQSLTNQHSFRFNVIVRRGEEESVLDLWNYLGERERKWHLVLLQEVPFDTTLWQTMVEAAQRNNHRVGVWRAFESPYVPITGDWDAYLATRSRQFVKNLARAPRRLGPGENRFDFELQGKDGWDPPAVAEALEIETKGWKGKRGTAIAGDRILTAFYTTWARTAAELGALRLSFLRCNGRRVAFEYAVEHAGRWYAMKAGYDPDFQRCSPGQLLCRDILKYCFDHRLIEFDFLGEVTEDKARWTGQARKHGWLYVYDKSFLARVHHFLKFSIRSRAKTPALQVTR